MAAKKMVARTTADRAEQLRKSKTRAGKSKASEIMRKVQNKEVKDGEIRVGKSRKTYNVYDSKSGTWKRGIVTGKKIPKKVTPSTSKPNQYGVSARITDRAAKPLPHKQGINTTFGSEGPKPKITKRYATRVSPSKRGEGSVAKTPAALGRKASTAKSRMKYGNR